MSEHWFYRLRFWLCEKTGHLGARTGWIYKGHYHSECKICRRIISTPCKDEQP